MVLANALLAVQKKSGSVTIMVSFSGIIGASASAIFDDKPAINFTFDIAIKIEA